MIAHFQVLMYAYKLAKQLIISCEEQLTKPSNLPGGLCETFGGRYDLGRNLTDLRQI